MWLHVLLHLRWKSVKFAMLLFFLPSSSILSILINQDLLRIYFFQIKIVWNSKLAVGLSFSMIYSCNFDNCAYYQYVCFETWETSFVGFFFCEIVFTCRKKNSMQCRVSDSCGTVALMVLGQFSDICEP